MSLHEQGVHADEPNDDTVVNVNVYVGQRMVDEDDWEPVEDQMVIGVEVDQFDRNESFGWEAAIFYASDDGTNFGGNVDASTTEFAFGIRKTLFTSSRFRPYIGVGLAGIRAEIDDAAGVDQDHTAGVYAHGGVYWELGQNFHLGVDVRTVFGTDVALNATDTDVDYVQGAVFGGLAF
ncbi:MAG: outer membrane protein [Planctomycetota bacterium]